MCVKLYVKHNAEIAHRLSQLPGKCLQIHGHSLQIELWLMGTVNDKGIMSGLDFGQVKAQFREYIDNVYDHRLLLNQDDQLLRAARAHNYEVEDLYPGIQMMPADPTIENLVTWIGAWANKTWPKLHARCKIQETNSNGAEWGF